MGTKLFLIALGISSMMFLVIFFVGKSDPISKESILKIIGEHHEDKIKNAKHDDEIAEIIRSLPKKHRNKLKTHFLSQDIRVAIKMFRKHIRNEDIEV